MDAKDPAVDDGSEAHVVKHLAAVAPYARAAVLFHALVVEAVHLGDLSRLVVAAEDEKVLGVFDLVGEEEADGFERLLASVDVVAEEEVVGFGRETAVLEQAQQVVVLSVDVTCMSGMRPSSAASNSK